jgi:hypothetical protein
MVMQKMETALLKQLWRKKQGQDCVEESQKKIEETKESGDDSNNNDVSRQFQCPCWNRRKIHMMITLLY